MPRGASAKREREYRELKHRFKQEHRYRGREEEVASRIVNKQRRQYGETRAQRRREQTGNHPDRDLPIDEYHHKTVDQIVRRLDGLSERQVRALRRYEQSHKQRKTLLKQIDRRL
jgi:hypothetical protein